MPWYHLREVTHKKPANSAEHSKRRPRPLISNRCHFGKNKDAGNHRTLWNFALYIHYWLFGQNMQSLWQTRQSKYIFISREVYPKWSRQQKLSSKTGTVENWNTLQFLLQCQQSNLPWWWRKSPLRRKWWLSKKKLKWKIFYEDPMLINTHWYLHKIFSNIFLTTI